MKKNIFYIVTISCSLFLGNVSSFELTKTCHNNQKIELSIPYEKQDFELIEDSTDDKGYNRTIYSHKDYEELSFSIESMQAKKGQPKNYFQRLWNVKTLLFPDLEYKNALQFMKDYRASSKKIYPYSSWRLLSAENENDIIFEAKVYGLGTHVKKQQITRLIKKDSDFFLISYKITKDYFTKKEFDAFYASLKTASTY